MGSFTPNEENTMPDAEPGSASTEPDPFDFDDLAEWDSDLFVVGKEERPDVANDANADTEREGLPQTYRMRHESHYIDELISGGRAQQIAFVRLEDITTRAEPLPDSSAVVEPLARSIARFGVLQPVLVRRRSARYELIAGQKRVEAARTAGVREIPCILCDVGDAEAKHLRDAMDLHTNPGTLLPARLDQLMLEIVDSLQTIVSGASLLRAPESRDRDEGALGLLRAEAKRTMRFAFGASFLGSNPALQKESFDARKALEEVLLGLEDEAASDAPRIVKEVVGQCSLYADRTLFTVAIVSALDAVRPQVTSREGFVAVRMGVHEASDGLVVQLRPSEPSSSAPTQESESTSEAGAQPDESRWLDPTWRDRPGGLPATVGLLVARRIAELHGGRMAVSSRLNGGCWVGLLFPADRASSA